MKISELLYNLKYTGTLSEELLNTDADFVTDDSRKVRKGCVFVATKGASFDGNSFITKALDLGAVLIVSERDNEYDCRIKVMNSRKAYALLCANLFGRPAEKLTLIGVTGTNGKTTSTFLIKDVLEKMGKKVGLIGTVQNMIAGQIVPAKFTTPQAYELNALFSQMVKAGCEYVVMEASSQALAQERLYGIRFGIALFTNLTQDHLDYHKTMENYFAAKCKLFENADTIIVNADDEHGRRIPEMFSDKQVITFSDKKDTADLTAKNLQFSRNGVRFVIVGKGSIERIDLPMPGDYSIHNGMGAYAVATALGFSSDEVARALSEITGVKGRCEILVKEPFTVINDFAHTGDGLENLLSSLKPFAEERFIVLFGCAGQRDSRKRYEMARAVEKYADKVILTSDNPRKESIESTMKECVEVFEEAGIDYTVIPDRRKAVNMALGMLKSKDMLLLCGKGHEDYQANRGRTLYLDEREIVSRYIREHSISEEP